jgi:hypothetical protein
MIGPVYDESTMLALAHACQRAIGLARRPPLDQFLAQKDEILAGEEFPDETRYYIDQSRHSPVACSPGGAAKG